jgi:hypothetical protein
MTVSAAEPVVGSTNDAGHCKMPSSTTTCLSDVKIVLGCDVTDKATVWGWCQGKTPTGTVYFQVSYNGGCSWITYDPCVPLVCGMATSTAFTPMMTGHFEFRAVYSGDCNYLCSESKKCSELLCVKKACPTIVTSIGATAVVENQAVTDNATVTGLGGNFSIPTGKVDFQVSYNNGTWMTYDANVCLVNGMATSAFYTPAEEGYYSFQALYSGDCNYRCAASASGSEILMVTEDGASQPGPDDSSTTVTAADAEPLPVTQPCTPCLPCGHDKCIELGESVTDNATVQGLGVGFPGPTGTVNFQVSYMGGIWTTYDGNVTLSNGMAMSTWYTPMAAGHYNFRAMYSGDCNYYGSKSRNCEEPLCVHACPSNTTTLLSASTIVYGNTVYDTATVTGLGGMFPEPTGTVNFFVSFNGGPWINYDPNECLINGVATSTVFAPLAAGNYAFMAVYSGDCNYYCSASGPGTELLTVIPALGQDGPTVTTYLGASDIMMGQAVTDNATVMSLGAPFAGPTGTITFYVSFNEGPWMVYDADVNLVYGNAVSAFYMPTAAGHYEFQAVYSGDGNYLHSVSGEDTELLNVTMAPSCTTTCLGTCHVTLGCSVFDKAFVSGVPGLPVPTGLVDFQVSYQNGTWMTYDSNVTLVNGCAMSCAYTPMAAGHYDFKAVYCGSCNYLGSMSGDCAEPLCVKQAQTTTTTDMGLVCGIPEPIVV